MLIGRSESKKGQALVAIGSLQLDQLIENISSPEGPNRRGGKVFAAGPRTCAPTTSSRSAS